MSDPSKAMEPILRDLEAIQVQIGKVQLSLLDLFTSDELGKRDEAVRKALIKLEDTQRGIGEVQVALIRQKLAEEEGLHPVVPGAAVPSAQPDQKPEVPVGEAKTSLPAAHLTGSDTRAWLEQRGIRIKSLRTTSGLDASADQVALFLGHRFATLEPFYTDVKRRLSGSYFNKWFKTEGLAPEIMTDICQFGYMLHRSGFLTQFKNVKRDKVILFDPLQDGRVTNFLEGGWLERYVWQVVKKTVEEAAGEWHDEQALFGVEVVLPDDTETEFDILLSLGPEKVLWIECKTGGWRTYVKHFWTINKQYLQLPATQAALVLLDHLTAEEQDSASALTSMTVLHLTEFSGWLTAAVPPA